MNKEDKIKRISLIQSVINSADHNIESLNRFKEVKEIVIMANDDLFKKFYETIKHEYSTKERPSPHYYTGKSKDEIIDKINERQEKKKLDALNEADDLLA